MLPRPMNPTSDAHISDRWERRRRPRAIIKDPTPRKARIETALLLLSSDMIRTLLARSFSLEEDDPITVLNQNI